MMTEGPAEEQSGVSDWEEQDLLTLDLAAQRLYAEIDRLRAEIDSASEEVDVTDAKVRLEQLVAASRRFGRPAP